MEETWSVKKLTEELKRLKIPGRSKIKTKAAMLEAIRSAQPQMTLPRPSWISIAAQLDPHSSKSLSAASRSLYGLRSEPSVVYKREQGKEDFLYALMKFGILDKHFRAIEHKGDKYERSSRGVYPDIKQVISNEKSYPEENYEPASPVVDYTKDEWRTKLLEWIRKGDKVRITITIDLRVPEEFVEELIGYSSCFVVKWHSYRATTLLMARVGVSKIEYRGRDKITYLRIGKHAPDEYDASEITRIPPKLLQDILDSQSIFAIEYIELN